MLGVKKKKQVNLDYFKDQLHSSEISNREQLEVSEEIFFISPDRIKTNPKNKEMHRYLEEYDGQDMNDEISDIEQEAFEESIREIGNTEPIELYVSGNDYILIKGERRYKAGYKIWEKDNSFRLKARISEKPDEKEEKWMLLENILRRGYKPKKKFLALINEYPELLKDITKKGRKKKGERFRDDIADAMGISKNMITKWTQIYHIAKDKQIDKGEWVSLREFIQAESEFISGSNQTYHKTRDQAAELEEQNKDLKKMVSQYNQLIQKIPDQEAAKKILAEVEQGRVLSGTAGEMIQKAKGEIYTQTLEKPVQKIKPDMRPAEIRKIKINNALNDILFKIKRVALVDGITKKEWETAKGKIIKEIEKSEKEIE